MLTCTACGTQNPPENLFCGNCGAALSAICPACATLSARGSSFCGACGSSLVTSADSAPATPAVQLVTERRVCSVLFADLVGFTPLSEARDPEEVRELLSGYFEVARTVIGRYGGVVEKFIGDAVMAVWGTPVARESDAERAVRAGLDLVASVAALGAEIGAVDLQLRAGVVTGEVAAALGATGEGMVAGDAVNTAARVQASAEPGTVWVDTATQRLAAAGVGFRNAGRHALKGKSAEVELWEATRVLASVAGVRRVDGLEAPMVGRDAENRTLRELFHACADRCAPRLVTVTGAAGTGKSRLGWEFEKYIDGLAFTVLWHRGRCLSYGQGVAYWALAQAVRQRLGIASEDPTEQARATFLNGLGQWIGSPDERSFVGVRLGRLLGLTHPDDSGTTLGQDDLFAGWRLFLERMADVAPVIVLIEDAHHADDALLDFLVQVADRAQSAPIYVVVLARSELTERRPSLATGRRRSSLTLDPLDERSMRTLATALVHDLPDPAVNAIAGQAQGNPLFAIETVRSLIDRDVIVPIEGEYRLVGDVGTLSVPDSLHGLLAARLDALDGPLRALVADAAVLGTSFPADALVAVSGLARPAVTANLAELVRRGVLDVTTDPRSPERGDYLFSQHLLRQVAYGTLSRRHRRALHLAVAEYLESTFAAGGDEVMDVIAQHYLDALAAVPGPDDSTIRQRALASLVRAAERSERGGAPLRAGRCYDWAADLVVDADQLQAAGLWERAGTAYGACGRYEAALEAERRAREVYLAVGQTRAAARTRSESGRWLSRLGRLAEGRAELDLALRELRAAPDADTVRALSRAASTAVFSGRSEARALADEAIGLGQALDVSLPLLAELFLMHGVADLAAHRLVESVVALRHAAQLAEQLGDRMMQGRALNGVAVALISTDPVQAATVAQTACDLLRMSGDRSNLEVTAATLGFARLILGEWDVGLAELEDVVRNDGDDLEMPAAVSAVVYALRGDVDRAAERARLPGLRASDDVETAALIRWVDAMLAAESGRTDRALEQLRPLFGTDSDTDISVEPVLLGWPLAVRCACDCGDADEVRRLIAGLDSKPIGQVPHLWRGARALAQAWLAVCNDDGSVDAAFDEAITALRGTSSPYHLAHGLLDHAAYLLDRGRDAAAQLDEATVIGEHLAAADIARRVHALDVHATLAR